MFPTAAAQYRGGDLRLCVLIVTLYVIFSSATVVVHTFANDNLYSKVNLSTLKYHTRSLPHMTDLSTPAVSTSVIRGSLLVGRFGVSVQYRNTSPHPLPCCSAADHCRSSPITCGWLYYGGWVSYIFSMISYSPIDRKLLQTDRVH